MTHYLPLFHPFGRCFIAAASVWQSTDPSSSHTSQRGPRVSSPLSQPLSSKREMFFCEGPPVPGTIPAAAPPPGSAPREGGTSPYASNGRHEAEGYVGFASLPNQVYRKAVKKGFEFTLMVVGKAQTFSRTTLLGNPLSKRGTLASVGAKPWRARFDDSGALRWSVQTREMSHLI